MSMTEDPGTIQIHATDATWRQRDITLHDTYSEDFPTLGHLRQFAVAAAVLPDWTPVTIRKQGDGGVLTATVRDEPTAKPDEYTSWRDVEKHMPIADVFARVQFVLGPLGLDINSLDIQPTYGTVDARIYTTADGVAKARGAYQHLTGGDPDKPEFVHAKGVVETPYGPVNIDVWCNGTPKVKPISLAAVSS